MLLVLDLVLINGLVIDPANRVMSKLNVGVNEGKIAAVTSNVLEGKSVIDCSGYIVTPGFIDMHMHEDPIDNSGNGFKHCISLSMMRMGVTTAIGGNCGLGPSDPVEYLSLADLEGYPVNIGLLSSHSNLRAAFGELDRYRDVSKAVIEKMSDKLRKELDGGTLGLSFGVRYIPGLDNIELEMLASVVSHKNKLLAAHVRDDAKEVIPSILELTSISGKMGAKLQISHIGSMAAYGQMEEALTFIDGLFASGLDVGSDCYPYSAFATLAGSTTFDEGFLERYNCGYDALRATQGIYRGKILDEKSFLEIRNYHPEHLIVAHVMKKEEVDLAMKHPRVIIASDGMLNEGHGHPRAAGTFPRVLGRYVREQGVLSLYNAIQKMTELPATRLGIDKGKLSVGSEADITVFDPNSVVDTADFEDPLKPPVGIRYVIINGEIALNNGEILRYDLGRAVRT